MPTRLKKFPLAKTIQHAASKTKGLPPRTNIVSEEICDHALQRLTPYLRKSGPIDIIDFWPGAGLWSSKVNDFLQPRRHLLIETPAYMKSFPLFTDSLKKIKPNIEIVPIDPLLDHDWPAFFRKHLPEQEPPSHNDVAKGTAKNDTLLILAGPVLSMSKRSHYTPARWWTRFTRSCAQLTDLHSYGCVKLLAFLPNSEIDVFLPRTVLARKGPALLTEAVSSRTFEVASSHLVGEWVASNQWDMLVNSAARVSERAAENGVVTPPGRECPPLLPLMRSPKPGRKQIPYVPQAAFGNFLQLEKVINEPIDPEADEKKAKKEKNHAVALVNLANSRIYEATELTRSHLEIDELMKSLSRKAADPEANPDALKALDKTIAFKTSSLHKAMTNVHYKITSKVLPFVDARRLALHSGSFDDSGLLRDRRPFEPLLIADKELYPYRDIYASAIVYFEANPDTPLMRRLQNINPSERNDLVNYIETVLAAMVKIGERTLAEILQVLFRDLSTNDVVRLLPTLAKFASKRLKPDFEKLPKTVLPSASPEDLEARGGRAPDPAASFQENIDYDFSDTRMRSLPVAPMLDIIFEYRKRPLSLSIMELTRHLGGTVTSAVAVGGLTSSPYRSKLS